MGRKDRGAGPCESKGCGSGLAQVVAGDLVKLRVRESGEPGVSVRDGNRVAALVRSRPTGGRKSWFGSQVGTGAAARQRLALSIGSQKKVLGPAAACDPRTGGRSG
jgi:hypothetical protein